MNSLSPYHSTSTDIVFKRFRLWKRQYLHIVIYTSLFWIFVDVFFIMLFTDCTKEIIPPCSSSSLLTNNNSEVIDHRLPFNLNRNIDKRRYRNKTLSNNANINEVTTKSVANKWWEINPGLNSRNHRKMFVFIV